MGKRSRKRPWQKWCRTCLPALNACLIAGLVIYYYDSEMDWIFWFIALFFIFAGDTKDRLIEYFTKKISFGAHLIVLSFLGLVYSIVILPSLALERFNTKHE